ncbi:TonB-dependent receptor [Elizabethkingia anophelis]|nr:TonB-dependent receptor [Elizabethkingia anophelis]MDC8028243.1 TonB-dependent receptor [Elizabethkingia anophelis]
MRYYHIIFINIVVIFLSNNIYAQNVKGIITKNNKSVDYAEIVLFNKNKKINTITNELGEYSLNVPNKDVYTLEVYQNKTKIYSKEVSIFNNITENINITNSEKEIKIKEVIVTGNKRLVERKIDRLVFNVENSIASQGMDGIETLSSTPLLKVDENSGISIVGKSGVSVMIDGKLLNFTGKELINYLQSLRSDNIAKVEVITTPPAKYEAQGNSGLINIVLKKNKNLGFNFLVSTGLSQASRLSTSNNFTINYSTNKLKTSLKLRQFDYMKNATENYIVEGEQSLVSVDKRLDFGNGWGTNFNIDYELNKKSNIGLIYNYGSSRSNMDINNTSIYKNKNIIDRDLVTYTENRALGKEHTLNAYYDLKIDSSKTVSVIANYFSNVPKTNVNFITENKINSTQDIVLNTSNVNYEIASGQIDFNLPFKWVTLETGTKLTSLSNNSTVRYYNQEILDPSRSNEFNYKEKNYALYLSLSKKINSKWSVMAGLRYEYSWIDGYSVTLNSETKYNYGKFFPSLYLVYQPMIIILFLLIFPEG